MFLPRDREEYLKDLEKLRSQLCCYGPQAKHCDCKYGADIKAGGEETGCPEIRAAIEIIKNPQAYFTEFAHIPQAKGCPVCGAGMVMIRGQHPGEPQRHICATCLVERLETLTQSIQPWYNTPAQEIKE